MLILNLVGMTGLMTALPSAGAPSPRFLISSDWCVRPAVNVCIRSTLGPYDATRAWALYMLVWGPTWQKRLQP